MIFRKHCFLSGAIGFLCGTCFVNLWGIFWIYLFALMVLLSIQTILLFPKTKILILLGIFFCGIGVLRASIHLNEISSSQKAILDLTSKFSRSVHVEGKIDSLQKQTDTEKSFLLTISKIQSASIKGDRILLILPANTRLSIGDIVEFDDLLSEPKSTSDFSYRNYLLLKEVFALSRPKNIHRLSATNNSFVRFLETSKTLLHTSMEAIYPPDTSAFLGGLLIGEKRGLDERTDSDFKKSGLSHIIAVSGFNITILIIFFTYLFQFFPKTVRLIGITGIIGLFLLFVGDQVSALRAAIMGLVGYYCVAFGKKADIFYLLLGVACFFVFLEPLMLNYDVSFHLSFLAVLGMMQTSSFFSERVFFWITKKGGIRESLVATFSAMSLTLPITLVNFGQISILSPVANLLCVPLLPLTTFIGFVSLFISWFWHTGGVFLGFFGWYLLKYILWIAHSFGNFDFALWKIDFGPYASIFEFCYFGCMLFLFVYFQTTPHQEPIIATLSEAEKV